MRFDWDAYFIFCTLLVLMVCITFGCKHGCDLEAENRRATAAERAKDLEMLPVLQDACKEFCAPVGVHSHTLEKCECK